MTLTEKIIKGLTEVKFEINPEMQQHQEWPAPEITDSHEFTMSDGNTGWAMTLTWPSGVTAEALEVHTSQGGELNIWAPLSTIKPGDWAKAMTSIKNEGEWNFNNYYVYIMNADDALYNEVSNIPDVGYALIDGPMGEDPVIDHFEAKDTEKPGDPEQSFGDGSAPLQAWAEASIETHKWIGALSTDSNISSSNPVTITVDYIDNGKSGAENKEFIGDVIADHGSLESVWTPGQNGWRIWPHSGNTPMEFNHSLGTVIAKIDKTVKAWAARDDDGDADLFSSDDDDTGDEVDGPVLSAGNKFEFNKRPWIGASQMHKPINQYNYVRILTDDIPIEGNTASKKTAVFDKFEELELNATWYQDNNSWLVWPDVGQSAKDFNKYINALMSRIDELIYPEEEEEPEPTYRLYVDHPNWANPVKHGGDFSTVHDAVESAKDWKELVTGPGNKNKSAKFKKGYSWKVVGEDGTLWGQG